MDTRGVLESEKGSREHKIVVRGRGGRGENLQGLEGEVFKEVGGEVLAGSIKRLLTVGIGLNSHACVGTFGGKDQQI